MSWTAPRFKTYDSLEEYLEKLVKSLEDYINSGYYIPAKSSRPPELMGAGSNDTVLASREAEKLPYSPSAYCETGKRPCNECPGCLSLHEEHDRITVSLDEYKELKKKLREGYVERQDWQRMTGMKDPIL